MPTYRDPNIPDEVVVVEDTVDTVRTVETADTVVGPPPPVTPPGVPPPPIAVDPAYPVDERIVVEDAAGTRIVSREVRPPMLEDDPRRYNWLAPTMVVICLAALGIVLAAVLLQEDDNASRPATATAPANPPPANPPPASVTVQVPSVVGQSRSQAESALRGAGFAVVVATVPGPEPTGQVLAQNPSAAEDAPNGDAVRINVSDGSQTAAAGAGTEAPATQTPATQTPATQTPATQTPATQAPATQAPAPQTPATQTPATPTPEPAPTTVSVPALSGDVKSAVQSLSQAGLLASIQYVPSDEPLGAVVAQSPSEGASAKTGAHVTLSVASGPGQKEQMTVPDASGKTIVEAVQAMNAAGLRLILVKKTVTDQEQAGDIVEQTPAAGATAPENAQIAVYQAAFKG